MRRANRSRIKVPLKINICKRCEAQGCSNDVRGIKYLTEHQERVPDVEHMASTKYRESEYASVVIHTIYLLYDKRAVEIKVE